MKIEAGVVRNKAAISILKIPDFVKAEIKFTEIKRNSCNH
jgi:hypothetical protein